MDPRTTTSGRAPAARGRARHRTPSAVRRPGLYLGVAAAGALVVNVLVGVEPSARAVADAPQSVAVAQELGLTGQPRPVDATEDLQPLEDLAASRSTREAERVAAQQVQAAADQAALDRQQAEADAAAEVAARAAAEAAARAAAEVSAAASAAAGAAAGTGAVAHQDGERPATADDAPPAAPAPTAAARTPAAGAPAAAAPAGVVARITNSAGSIRPQVQAAANAVVSAVPGAGGITLGGTRASAADPGGHPSGRALDYMVMSDAGLGDAIVAYHRAHWDELGVDYLIWQQRMLSSPGGSWKPMENRGSATANHMDHVHVNYRG